MSDDAELLQTYVKDGSEPAFRELVGRHIPLVMAAARRIVAGDEHLAQDVTQLVFSDLARKAATLPTGVVLGGWLHRHTCFTAAKAVRTESRRRTRERTAMENDILTECSARDEHWCQLAPVLDDALNHLDSDDRDAVVLRFFEQRDLRSIGAALGVSDDTAQKRIARALEKLRGILTQRGVTLSSALLATALDAGAAPVPVTNGLATTISASALSGAAAATSTTLLTSTLKIMTASKLTLSVAALVIALSATYLLVQHKTASSPIAVDSTTSTASASQAPAKPSNAAKVETPKVAPAPAGGSVSKAGTITVANTGSLSFGPVPNNTVLSKWKSDPNRTGPFSDWASIIADQRSKLEQTRQLDEQIIASNTAAANGDPAQLAKVAAMQQQYDSQLLAQQKKIDALESDPAAQAAYISNLQSGLADAKKTLARSITLATTQAKGDPAMLAKIEASRQQTEALLLEGQKALETLSANLPPITKQASTQAALIATKRADLEKFKTMTQQVLAQAAAHANGDPAELAKMEAARKQYDDYIQQKQQEIDALAAQSAP